MVTPGPGSHPRPCPQIAQGKETEGHKLAGELWQNEGQASPCPPIEDRIRGWSHTSRSTQPCPAVGKLNLPFPPTSSPRAFPTISVKTMARELQMGTATVRSEQSEQENPRCKECLSWDKTFATHPPPSSLIAVSTYTQVAQDSHSDILIQSLWKQKQADLSSGPA